MPAVVLGPGVTCDVIAERVSGLATRPISKTWLGLLAFATLLSLLLLASIIQLFYEGTGVWGINQPVAWGFAISNYVFWIAIAMGGTFISAGLLLARQHWRTSINRLAETMTLLAALNAGLYPLLHIGSPWVFYYLFPYPNPEAIWPQFRSPLIWDVVAVMLYLMISVALWYVSLIPDLAMMRDRVTGWWPKRIFGLFALGWRGSSRNWKRYQVAYLILAGLTVPVVFSVHSVTAADFATTLLPWWHETIFPPYFIGGAIFSGVAMAMVLAISLRSIYGLRDFITEAHLNAAGKLILASGLVVSYSYCSELWMSWYSGDPFDWFQTLNYVGGHYAWMWWVAIGCNTVVPQLLWLPRVRRNARLMFFICLSILVGMWTERYMILVPPLSMSHLPSLWGEFGPTFNDWSTFAGTIGFFFFGFLLFLQFLPMMASSELMELSHSTRAGRHPPMEFSPAHAE
ncbi:MAG TPA: NrfD/PsrC family molybdoenzyme membrane anchor subunit [Tepidisphaeraceae bacterium]|nr:NrfD/PsrC family molybdoenzyme membrane anchor subunit [Tepidisphaeraceae bacterium]